MNCLKVDRIQDYEKNKMIFFFFDRIIHKQVGRLEALQMADAQSTGLAQRRRPLEMDTR